MRGSKKAGTATGAVVAATLLALGTAPAVTAESVADSAERAAPEDAGGRESVPARVRIHDVQGTTRLSPFAGRRVNVPGIVTATRTFGSSRGFWLQDDDPDDDPRTSEGLFVFTGSDSPGVREGDRLRVTGTVAEYYPDDPATSDFQSSTELTDAEWTVLARGGDVPEPLALRPHTVPERRTAEPEGSIEHSPLRPGRYALDFWEAHEGELVSVTDVRLVSRSTDYHELYVTTKPEQNPTPRGGTVYLGYDRPNTGVLKVESLIPFAERPFPTADTGDTLAGRTAGPLAYDRFGGYTMMATELGQVVDGGLEREVTRAQRPGELSVATYNVENLSAADDAETFAELARGVVHHLAAPDIVTLAEIQDDNGPGGVGDGVTSAERTLRRFTDAIADAGGPRYEWRQIDPVDGADGGQPGGNIRVGFLFDPERVSFVDRPGGDATTPVRARPARGGARLSVSPGRVAPNDPAFDDSRKPLAGEFRFRGRTVFVLANHFTSKGGDQPVHGRFQPPTRRSEQQRVAQAERVRAFVDELLAVDPRANVVVAGDLNDYQFSPTLDVLTEGGALRSLLDTLPPEQRYSYVYQGNAQVLDHILVSSAPRRVDYDVVHINAEFATQASDHDPQITRLVPS